MKILFLGNTNKKLFDILCKTEDIDFVNTKITPELVKNYDFIISFGYRYIVKKNVINLFTNNNIINLHISYLPYNRGSDPIWSILDGTPAE